LVAEIETEDVSMISNDNVLATGMSSLVEDGVSHMCSVNYSKDSVEIIGEKISVDELYPNCRSFNGNGNSVYDDFARNS
jgi:hypothetical protein